VTQDRGVVMLVIGILGTIALSCIAVLAVLLLHERTVGDSVLLLFSNLAIGSASAIGGLLANTHTSPPNPPTTEVPVAAPDTADQKPPQPVVLRPGQPVNQPKGA
jgi:hypothetical protein